MESGIERYISFGAQLFFFKFEIPVYDELSKHSWKMYIREKKALCVNLKFFCITNKCLSFPLAYTMNSPLVKLPSWTLIMDRMSV